MTIKLTITNPSAEIGFIERRRSFCVYGTIESDSKISDNALLTIQLFDKEGNVVRNCQCERKNKPIYVSHPDLTCYPEELDPNREKMKDYGFSELVCDDIDDPLNTLRFASKKCWYSDNTFRAIIVNASNVDTGALLDDGLNLLDDNNQPYHLLPIGQYKLVVTLNNNQEISTIEKNIEIGYRKVQAICRFNPIEHKENMIKWCNDVGFSIIKDSIPGYLDSYLGVWLYHLGLLKMYRANDVCMYENVDIVMFLYLIDTTSTSYSTELAYIQKNDMMDRLTCYCYDIGEAKVSNLLAHIEKIDQGEARIQRVDFVNEKAIENIYFLDERHITDYSNLIQIKGVIAPWKMDSNDFILNNDNSFTSNNYPEDVVYTVIGKNKEEKYYRKCNMERIDVENIGNSVFEFYNIIDISSFEKDNNIRIYAEIIDHKKERTFKTKEIEINLSKRGN